MNIIFFFYSLLIITIVVFAGDPQFDPTTLMELVMVPADIEIGTIIYRIRASDIDFDYPLQFELLDEASKSTIKIDTLACSRYNSVCQANVVLQKRLQSGRYYDFRVRVQDTKGNSNTIKCTITATNNTTPRDLIFPKVPDLIMIPEDAKRGTELGSVIARKNPSYPKPAYVELWGSPVFAIRQRAISDENTEATIFLLGQLDYEKQAMYHLSILANDPYAITKYDTRNIAAVQIVVIIQDVQDQPPIFTEAPPVTQLDNSLVPGDIVVRVHAEDGDKGAPRQIQYGLVSEGNPFTPFFNISEKGGEIILARPLDEITAISHPGVPILLTVIAEEIKTGRDEPPAMSSTVQLALILGERGNQPPYFENDNYVSRIEENAPQGTALVFSDPYIPQVSDDDMGKNGVFALTLENNNGTFEISPNVGERRAQFLIKVRDNTLLDYEQRQTVQFRIIAQELGPATNLSASVDVTVFLIDMNDNPPIFMQDQYQVELPENMTAQTRVTQVYAEDVDTGLYGKVRYTQIIGNQNQSLNLDPITGVITVTSDNHGFDREAQEEYRFYVEARDDDGEGNRATVPLVIKLIDVNDNAPIFERSLYEFILAPDLRNFTNPAIIHAVDADTDYPNNVVRYEIRLGNYDDKFFIVPDTGEILLNAPLARRNQAQRRRQKRQQSSNPEIYVLTARAYDLGVPHMYSDCDIRIYPPESRARTIVFIVAGSNPDRRQTENMLAALTGGRVTIQSIRPYNGREIGGATDVTSSGDPNSEKSVVVANVLYNGNSVVDVSHLQNPARNSSIIHRTEDSLVTTVREYRSDSSDLLFWLLILLAFLILSLIILLLCCLCQGCPLYKPLKRVIHSTASVAENVHLVHSEKQLVAGGNGAGHENKSVQAVEWGGRGTRKEAWSADLVDTRTKATQWQFNRRNNKHHRDTMSLKGYDNGSLKDLRTEDEKSTLKVRGGDEDDIHGPNVIYSREWQQRQTDADDPNKRNVMYIEDMENSLGHQRNEVVIDDDSLRRHEYERGSDDEYRNSLRRKLQRQENMVINDTEQAILQNGREQLFIKDGNTEILRLVTRNGRVQEELLQQQQMGRPITIVQPPQTMIQPQYIMVDNEGKNILMQRYIEQQSILNPIHQNMMAMRSNPASVITQNEPYIPVSMANIPGGLGNTIQIPVTSVNSNLESESIPIIPPSNTNMTTTNPSYVSHTRKSTPTHAQHITSELLETSLRQQNELLRQILLEKERLQQQAGVAAAGSRAEGSHNEDELMKMETQSLPPFQMTTIGVQTQTDCNSSTQTDLDMLRPVRRQTRSDNDSFSEDDLNSDNDDEYQVYIIGGDTDEANTTAIRLLKRRKYYKKRKSRLKRDHRGTGGPSGGSMSVIRVVEEIKRKIKTPILEESEQQSPTNHNNVATSPIKVAQIESASSPKRTIKSGGGIQKEVLREISDSLVMVENPSTSKQNVPEEERRMRNRAAVEKRAKFSESKSSTNHYENVQNDKEFSDDSLNNESETTHKKHLSQGGGSSTEVKENLKNESKLKTPKIPPKPKRKKENITTHLVDRSEPPLKGSNQKPQTSGQQEGGGTVDVSKSVPRYMQWYKNKKERDKDTTREHDSSTSTKSKSSSGVSSTKNKVSSVRKKVAPKKTTPAEPPAANPNPVETTILPDTTRLEVGAGGLDIGIPAGNPGTTVRPLLQHSEHRYEHMYPYPPILYAQPAQIPQHMYVDDAQSAIGHIIPPPPIIIQPASSVTTQESTPVKKQNPIANQMQNNTTITTTTVITPAPPTNVAPRIEDDYDSGIAMTSLQQQQQQQQYPVASYPPGGIVLKKPAITEKKSVFTIKYDDMHTKQLTADSDTPPY